MATVNEIKSNAQLVKNATEIGENTAPRVGGVLVDMADHLPETIEQATGTSTTSVMSQKAVTDELAKKANQSDVEDALAGKVDNTDIVQEIGESESTVMSQKAVTDAILNKIDLSAIDFDSQTIAKLALATIPTRYNVISSNKNVGIMEVFSDNNGHMVTEVFDTHYIVENGALTGGHSDDKTFRYKRSYHLIEGGTSDIPVGSWGEWEQIYASDDIQNLYERKVNLGEADPETVPIPQTVTADTATKALQDWDGNDLRKATYMTGVLDYEEFSTSKAYSVGDVVFYNNKLYKFIVPHSAGAFDEAQVEETNTTKALITNEFGDSEDNILSQNVVTNNLNEFNVSVNYPTDGIEGTNKYTLETAIEKIPENIKRRGLKLSFVNTEDKIETWEAINSNFTVNSFLKTGVWELNRIDSELGLFTYNGILKANTANTFMYISHCNGIEISNINTTSSITVIALEIVPDDGSDTEFSSITFEENARVTFNKTSTVRLYCANNIEIGGDISFTIKSINGIVKNIENHIVFNANTYVNDYNRVFSLTEVLSLVPQEYRYTARCLVFRSGVNNGDVSLALFKSNAFVSHWDDIDYWLIINSKTFYNIESQPILSQRTENLFNYKSKDISFYSLDASAKTYSVDNNKKNYVFLLGEIKTGDVLYENLFMEGDYTSLNLSLIRMITTSNLLSDDGGNWIDDTSYSRENKRGNLKSTINGYVYLVLQFINTPNFDEVLNIIQNITVKTDGYASSYIPYYKGYVEEDDLSEELKSKINNGTSLGYPFLKRIDEKTINLGENIISSVETGDGWSISDGKYTHNSGTEPLKINANLSANTKYVISLILGNTAEEALHININGYPDIDTYNGSTNFNVGVVLDTSVSQIDLTPVSTWVGSTSTVESIEVRQVIDDGSFDKQLKLNVYNEVFDESSNDITSFWNVLIGDETTAESRQNITRCIALGYQSLRALISGTRNVAVGTFAMSQLISGERNVAIGADSFWYMKKGNDNVAIGKAALGAMSLNTEANQNTCVGSASGAGIQANKAQNNTCLGMRSMGGNNSMYNTNDNRSDNTCIGAWAGYYADNQNVCVGDYSGHYSKENNTHIGHRAGFYTKGSNNTYIGNEVGSNYVTGDNCTLIGANITYSVNQSSTNIVSINNSIAIGCNAVIEKSNQAVIGNELIEETDLFGDLVITDKNGVKRRIIFNEDGNITWQTV